MNEQSLNLIIKMFTIFYTQQKILMQKTSIMKKLLLVIAIISLIYIGIRIVPIDVIVAMIVFNSIFAYFLYINWKMIRNYGIINYLPPKLKQALLNKSIFDIYSDLVYYPKITKLIKIFIMPLITKPQPEELFNEFQELPEKMKQAISTKGILHLLPNKIQNIVLKTDEVLPSQNYGKIDRSWYYQQEYQKQKEKRMLKKQRSYIKQYAIRKIQNKKWHNYILISILTIVLSQKLKNFQLKKLLNKRLFECGAIILIISLVMTFIKIRTEKKRKNNELRND